MTREEHRAKCLDANIVGTALTKAQRTYLMMRHFGVADDDMMFHPEHGVIVRKAAHERIRDRVGTKVAPDVERWTCYDVVDGKLVVSEGDHRAAVTQRL
jgi:hypothetical protein